jgi:regulator of protease activity HflC (stomatin/prohibitin superfamily)
LVTARCRIEKRGDESTGMERLMKYLIFLILLLVLALPSIKILRRHERMVVLRLGRFARIVGPGVVFLIPVVDKGLKVNLKETLPGWEAMSTAELERRVQSIVLGRGGQG